MSLILGSRGAVHKESDHKMWVALSKWELKICCVPGSRRTRNVWKCGRKFPQVTKASRGRTTEKLIFRDRIETSGQCVCERWNPGVVMRQTCKSTLVDAANEGSSAA